jgi:enoyl-CoA hydratase
MATEYEAVPLKVYLTPAGGKPDDALVPEDYTPISLQFLFNAKKGVALVIFGNPKVMNAFRIQLHWEFHIVLEHVKRDPAIKVVVWTGAGEQAFSSGADFTEGFSGSQTKLPDRVREQYTQRECCPIPLPGKDVALRRLTSKFWDLPKPSLCAVNGVAVGFGANFVLCHDIAIGAPHCRFRWPFCDLAIVPEMGSSMLLAQRLGLNKAKELVFTGNWMSAEEALRFGLLNAIYPKEQILPKTLELAELIAPKSATSLKLTKQLFNSHAATPQPFTQVVAAENVAIDECMKSKEFVASMQRFMAQYAKSSKL